MISNNTNNKCDCTAIDEKLVGEIKASMICENEIQNLSNLFKVLGDPTRAKIVMALDKREVCVCDLSVALNMTKSAVSHQLAVLKANNIVKSRREGKHIFYSFDDEHITTIIEIADEHIKHKH